jgi:ubiquinone/menaquinone biosynthesis C-methylase UbiE
MTESPLSITWKGKRCPIGRMRNKKTKKCVKKNVYGTIYDYTPYTSPTLSLLPNNSIMSPSTKEKKYAPQNNTSLNILDKIASINGKNGMNSLYSLYDTIKNVKIDGNMKVNTTTSTKHANSLHRDKHPVATSVIQRNHPAYSYLDTDNMTEYYNHPHNEDIPSHHSMKQINNVFDIKTAKMFDIKKDGNSAEDGADHRSPFSPVKNKFPTRAYSLKKYGKSSPKMGKTAYNSIVQNDFVDSVDSVYPIDSAAYFDENVKDKMNDHDYKHVFLDKKMENTIISSIHGNMDAIPENKETLAFPIEVKEKAVFVPGQSNPVFEEKIIESGNTEKSGTDSGTGSRTGSLTGSKIRSTSGSKSSSNSTSKLFIHTKKYTNMLHNAPMNEGQQRSPTPSNIVKTKSYLLDPVSNMEISVRNQNELQYALHNPKSKIYKKVVHDVIMKPFRGYDQKQKLFHDDFMKKIVAKVTYQTKGFIQDKEIYSKMHVWMNKHYYPVMGYPDVESDARSMVRVDDIMYMLKQMNISSPSVYLDIGCSEGGITQLLGKELGLSSVYGIDIIDETELKKVEGTNVDMVYIKMSPETTVLPFGDSSVDLITALMSFHHIKNYAEYIKEIGRILRDGGVLIIQEHNAMDEDDKIAIDILHGMYTMVWAKTGQLEDETFVDTYEANYKSRNEWTTYLENEGLHEIKINEPAKWKAIPRKNIHNNYWAMYVKKGV